MQTVTVAGSTYYNAVVTVASVVSIGSMTGSDTYNASASALTIPRIQVGNTVYSDVVATVVPSSLVIHGGMPDAVADSVSLSPGSPTAMLSVPAIQYGNFVFTNVVVQAEDQGRFLGVHPYVHSFLRQRQDRRVAALWVAGHGRQRNLYGTTDSGGANFAGTVFKITPSGSESVLYAFTGGVDGRGPYAGLAIDGNGNLYGTTTGGGRDSHGTVFMITPTGTESVLYSFSGAADGGDPSGELLLDGSGNLYGTTVTGGTGASGGSGTVFKITMPGGAESVLHSFAGGTADGAYPSATLIMDSAGNPACERRNTAARGGAGIVFKLTPSGTESILHGFAGGADGANPMFGGVVMDGSGNLYGTTLGGGPDGSGTVSQDHRCGSGIRPAQLHRRRRWQWSDLGRRTGGWCRQSLRNSL